jgi:hypothetical protein
LRRKEKEGQGMKDVLQLAAACLAALACVNGCAPGYIKASELEARGQGPAECARSCEGLKMRMAALVLVGNDLPGCVCQPLPTQAAPLGAPLPQPQQPQESALSDGAAASTTGYVVLAAAAAAREQQRKQQQLQQQQQKK